jgi:hypothetical protein
VTDFDIFQIVLVFLFIQLVMLIGFSAAKLSEAKLSIGTGATVDKFVWECTQQNKFME